MPADLLPSWATSINYDAAIILDSLSFSEFPVFPVENVFLFFCCWSCGLQLTNTASMTIDWFEWMAFMIIYSRK